jgi:hypothetical protein
MPNPPGQLPGAAGARFSTVFERVHDLKEGPGDYKDNSAELTTLLY